MLFLARYFACAQATTPYCYVQDDDFLVWPLQTQINSYLGMAIGYLVLTLAYYKNSFGARDLKFMSTSLFDSTGATYNQTAILTSENTLDPTKLAEVGLPRYTATYVVSQMCYNFSLGAALVHVGLWHWRELKEGKCLSALLPWFAFLLGRANSVLRLQVLEGRPGNRRRPLQG